MLGRRFLVVGCFPQPNPNSQREARLLWWLALDSRGPIKANDGCNATCYVETAHRLRLEIAAAVLLFDAPPRHGVRLYAQMVRTL